MCVGDWRLGRFIRCVGTPFDISTGAGVTLAANPHRVGICAGLSVPSSSTVTQSVWTFTNGILVPHQTNNAFKMLTMVEFGDLVTRGVTISNGLNQGSGAWGEFFLPEAILGEALENLQREYPKCKMWP